MTSAPRLSCRARGEASTIDGDPTRAISDARVSSERAGRTHTAKRGRSRGAPSAQSPEAERGGASVRTAR